jgi:glycosyltransferase involved in cell wall biosynthesis
MVGPWPPTKGGITTFMLNVVNSPLRQRYRFIPFTTSRPGKRNVKGDNYGYFAMFRGGIKRALQGILITLWHVAIFPFVTVARWPAVVQIHASDFQAFWEAAAYLVMAKLLGRPVVLRIGGSFDHFWNASGARVRRAISWTIGRADLLVVQSEFWRAYHRETVGRSGPIAIVNNFVPEALVVRRAARGAGPVRFLLYAGENPELKGAYLVFEAARLLQTRGVPCRIRLMACTEPLRQEIAGAGHPVEPLGFLAHDRVIAELRDTDVFLQISSSEGFPNTLLEAMASGCCAIVTPTGAVPEIVGAEGACAFTIGRDAAMLAARMETLARDPALAAAMAARAQDRIAERFTERTVAAVLDEAYRAAMIRGARGRGVPTHG